MLVGEPDGLRGHAPQLRTVERAVEVLAQRRQALDGLRFFQQMLDALRASVGEFMPQALVARSVEVELPGELIEGCVHVNLSASRPSGQETCLCWMADARRPASKEGVGRPRCSPTIAARALAEWSSRVPWRPAPAA